MAFTDLGSIASGGSSGNNQASLTVATTASCSAGELVVVVVSVDNQATGGGDDLSTSGVTIGGVALTKGRQNATNLAAQAGASVSLWWGVLAGTVASGSNIIASFTTAGSSDATALSARHFSFTSGATLSVEATNAGTATTTNPGSLNATTANLPCLRIRAIGCEYDSTQALTVTASWTAWAEGASAATGTITEQVIEAEHRISTGTGDASAPTLGSACDSASVYVAFKEVAGPTVLSAVAGSYTLTGSNVVLGLGYKLTGFDAAFAVTTGTIFPVAAGSYALTGSNAALLLGHTTAVGSYVLSGANAALALKQSSGSGSYTLTGTGATFPTLPTGGPIVLSAAAGSYALTGSDTVLGLGYFLTGSDVAFRIGLPGGIVAASGAYALSGSPIVLGLGYFLTGSSANFVTAAGGVTTLTANGAVADFIDQNGISCFVDQNGETCFVDQNGLELCCDGGYFLTGSDVAFRTGGLSKIVAAAGSYAISGSSAALALRLSANSGAYTLGGSAAPLALRLGAAAAGSYTLTGSAVGFAVTGPITFPATAGSYTITGSSAALARRLSANSGSYTVSGSAAVLARGFAAGAGAYAILGTDAQLRVIGSITLTYGAGSYLLTGTAAALRASGLLMPTPPERRFKITTENRIAMVPAATVVGKVSEDQRMAFVE